MKINIAELAKLVYGDCDVIEKYKQILPKYEKLCAYCGKKFYSTDSRMVYCKNIKDGETKPCCDIAPEKVFVKKYPEKVKAQKEKSYLKIKGAKPCLRVKK